MQCGKLRYVESLGLMYCSVILPCIEPVTLKFSTSRGCLRTPREKEKELPPMLLAILKDLSAGRSSSHQRIPSILQIPLAARSNLYSPVTRILRLDAKKSPDRYTSPCPFICSMNSRYEVYAVSHAIQTSGSRNQ